MFFRIHHASDVSWFSQSWRFCPCQQGWDWWEWVASLSGICLLPPQRTAGEPWDVWPGPWTPGLALPLTVEAWAGDQMGVK